MKKLYLLGLAVVMSSMLIAGCAKKDTSTSPIVTHSVHFVVEAEPAVSGDVLSSAASVVYTSPDSHSVLNAPLPWTSSNYNVIAGAAVTITVNCAGDSMDSNFNNTKIKLTIYKDGTAINTGTTQLSNNAATLNTVATLSSTI